MLPRSAKGGHIVKLEDDINRVILFCRHVLNPSLAQADANKNCVHNLVPEITFGMNVKLVRLVRGVLSCLTPLSVKRAGLEQEEVDVVLLTTVKSLLGLGPNEDQHQQEAFRRVHRALIEQTAMTSQPSLFVSVRQLVSLYTAPFLRTLDESEDEVGRWANLRYQHAERVVSSLFESCLALVAGIGSSSHAARLESFYLQLLTCPMLTLLLSAPVKPLSVIVLNFPASLP